MESVPHVLQADEGEVLKLGPLVPGDVIVKVDPEHAGSTLTIGTHTIPPGSTMLMRRYLHQETVLLVQKGQGRVILEGQHKTVVPGTTVYVPRHAWHGLRNTGTGLLQVAWISTPPGLEAFFRELAHLGSGADSVALEAIAQRYGVEFRPEGAPDVVGEGARGPGRRRRRRGGRAHRSRPTQSTVQQRPTPVSSSGSVEPSVTPISAPVSPVSSTPSALPSQTPSSAGRRHRRPHRARRPTSVSVPPASATPTPQASQPPATPPRPAHQRSRDRRRGPVKEVYMGGRWVRVSGEGPVIAPGS